MRGIIEDYYDIQKMRIETENQIRSIEQGKSKGNEAFLREKILPYMKTMEKEIIKYSKEDLENYKIYTLWLKNIKGIGPILGLGLISWIEDIKKFATISKLWCYFGQAVGEDGRAVRKKKGEKVNWNTRLKVLAWKIGESFVKTKGGYRKLYEQFRAEYDEKWKTPEDCGSPVCIKHKKCFDAHRYAAAKRKTVKVFLAHLFMKWRELEGLPEEHPFIIGRDNHQHLIEPLEE